MNTLDEFIAQHGLTMDATMTDRNPHMGDSMPVGSSHWQCEIHNAEGQAMRVYFSMGPAHTGEPDLALVLDAVASDVASVRNEPDWLEWGEEMGYSGAEEYRRARAAHATITEQGEELGRLLGAENLETLLWNTERM